MIRRSYSCEIPKDKLHILLKNPHTIQFFCNLPEYISSDITKHGFHYSREYSGEEIKDTKLREIKEKYYRRNLPLFLDEIEPWVPYEPRKQRPSTVFHYGQLKLFLTTIMFLSTVNIRKNSTVIYAGAAPGDNTSFSKRFFPNVKKWILVDPARFSYKLKDEKDVVLINDFFTDELAKELKKEKNIIFISDIRLDTDEKDIHRDMEDQLRWYNILKPYVSMFKFRLPRDVENYEYLDGKILIQPYAPISTTESRLIVTSSNAKMINYNVEEYEGKFFTFNRLHRACNYGRNLERFGYDNCYDCSIFFEVCKLLNPKSPGKQMDEVIKFLNMKINKVKDNIQSLNKEYY